MFVAEVRAVIAGEIVSKTGGSDTEGIATVSDVKP
jgi:hypothetical protein